MDYNLALNILMERMGLASLMGMQYSGDRDVYAAAGYPRDLTFDDYLHRYTRQDVARRIIDLPVDDSWLHAPTVYDGPSPKEAVGDTPFLQAWLHVAQGSQDAATLDGVYDRGLLHDLNRLDRLCGIGRYAVLLLGFRDNKGFDQPVKADSLKGAAGLSYATAFSGMCQ